MQLLSDANQEKKLDLRVLERNLRRGSVSSEEVEKILSKLPDDSVNADWVNIDSLLDGKLS